MALVGLAVAIPATLLLADDDDRDGVTPAVSALATEEPPVPALGPGGKDSGLGVSYRVPREWSEAKEASAIRLRSADRSAEIVIAAPAQAAESKTVLDDALAAIERGYEDVEVVPGSGREIGGLDAEGAVVSASADGVALRILVAVAEGAGRTYLVEVFTTADIPPERLREAQVALNSLELEG
jgi:hypothetical protein